MIDESFGPIIGLQKVSSDEEATTLMLDTEYGLTSAVFSNNEERAIRILDNMNSGTVYWNCCDRVSPKVPWSGRKNSGLGSTLVFAGHPSICSAESIPFKNAIIISELEGIIRVLVNRKGSLALR